MPQILPGGSSDFCFFWGGVLHSTVLYSTVQYCPLAWPLAGLVQTGSSSERFRFRPSDPFGSSDSGSIQPSREFVPGGIRDITPHFIHHSSQGLDRIIPRFEESRSYDPESISPSYELCRFFETKGGDLEGSTGGGPGGQQNEIPTV